MTAKYYAPGVDFTVKSLAFGKEGRAFNAASLSGSFGEVGNIYLVWQTSKTAIMADMVSKYGNVLYEDGSAMLYADAGTGDGIQAAINACKGGRNDYVFVGTGNYNLAAALTIAGKSSVHLVGINGGGNDCGTAGAAALTQTGNFEAIIMAAYDEVTGFQIINKAGYSAITVPAGTWRVNIHHNYFHMTGTDAAINIIDCSASQANSHGRIWANKFGTWGATALNSAIYVAATCVGTDVCNNQIVAHTGLTMDYGIVNLSVGGVTGHNIVSEAGGSGATSGGTVTSAIYVAASGTVIGNRCAVGTGQGYEGGTASHSFCDNMDAVTEGTGGITAQLET
jgi:hypothetical protein